MKQYIVLPFPAVHDTSNAVGYFIKCPNGERVLYAIDSAKTSYDFDGVTHFIAEVNFDEATLEQSIKDGITPALQENRLRSTHKSLEQFAEELKAMDKSKLQQIWIAHCSNRNLNKTLAKTVIQEIAGCEVYFA